MTKSQFCCSVVRNKYLRILILKLFSCRNFDYSFKYSSKHKYQFSQLFYYVQLFVSLPTLSSQSFLYIRMFFTHFYDQQSTSYFFLPLWPVFPVVVLIPDQNLFLQQRCTYQSDCLVKGKKETKTILSGIYVTKCKPMPGQLYPSCKA